MRERITAVVTSCGRQDLLKKTLRSFLRYNTCPIEKIIITEDGDGTKNNALKKTFDSSMFLWLETGRRIGQIRSVDHAYSHVETDYIFHLEDDWLFYRSGFMEKSLKILQSQRKCLQVWIRLFKWLRHPLHEREYSVDGSQYRILRHGYQGVWHGFSFNPGLRRRADYTRIGKYSDHVSFDFNKPSSAEERLNGLYRDMGYFSAILSDNDGEGYVRHIGVNRHVDENNTPLAQLGKKVLSVRNQLLHLTGMRDIVPHATETNCRDLKGSLAPVPCCDPADAVSS